MPQTPTKKPPPGYEERIEGPKGYIILYDAETLSITLYHHEPSPGRRSKNDIIKVFAEGDEEIVYHMPRQFMKIAIQMIGISIHNIPKNLEYIGG